MITRIRITPALEANERFFETVEEAVKYCRDRASAIGETGDLSETICVEIQMEFPAHSAEKMLENARLVISSPISAHLDGDEDDPNFPLVSVLRRELVDGQDSIIPAELLQGRNRALRSLAAHAHANAIGVGDIYL